MKKFFTLLMIVFAAPAPFGCQVFAAGEEIDALQEIAKANDLYLQKQYRETEKIYLNLLSHGYQNGYLFYNLGNTCIRLGKLGPAILYYLKGKQLVPRDQALNANLKYAIRQTRDQLSLPSGGILSSIFFWSDNLNLNEHFTILVFLNILFWLAMIFWFLRRTVILDISRKTILVFLSIWILSTGSKWYQETHFQTGVVLEDTIDVKSEQNADNVTLFQLHEGAIVTILETRDDWCRIRLNDGKNGWVLKTQIGV